MEVHSRLLEPQKKKGFALSPLLSVLNAATSSDRSRHFSRGDHIMRQIDPYIQQGGQLNMSLGMLRQFFHWRGPKSIAKLDGGYGRIRPLQIRHWLLGL